MSARAPFAPNPTDPKAKSIPKPQAVNSDSGQDVRGDTAPSKPLKVSNIKGLNSAKKPSTRSSTQQNVDPRQAHTSSSLLSDASIESPQPHPAPMPFSQHLLNTLRPASPANPRSSAPMLPPPPPPPSSLFSHARPASRAAHNPDHTHTNIATNTVHSVQSTITRASHPHIVQANTSHASSRESPVPAAFEPLSCQSQPFELEDSPRPPAERRCGEDQHDREPYRYFVEEPPTKRRRRESIEPHVHFRDDQHDSTALSDHDMFLDYAQHDPTRHDGPDQYNAAPLQGVFNDFDMAMFAGDYVKRYQENLAKWENCTMAEWEAHGAVLNQKFGDLVDMVKDHMQRKLQLYASLKGVTQKHRDVLGQREQAIREERGRLLAHVTGVGGHN